MLPFPCCCVFSFLLELANIWLFTNHFSLALFAYQINLEWTKCKWESGSPGEFLRETMWVLLSKWSPTSVFRAPGRQCEFEMQWGKAFICYKGMLSVFGQISDLERAGIWWFTSAQCGHSHTETYIKSICDSLSPTMSLIHSLIRHSVLGWTFLCLMWVVGSF